MLSINDWKKATNIYEVNIRQYSPEGTFNALIKELPRLWDLGVKMLWLMPITPIAREKRKGTLGSYYACSDYMSVNPEFGSLEDFKNMMLAAHDIGFKMIIDWVANHTGWDHVWTKSHPEFYKKDPITGHFKTASGMDDIIELDYSNAELRKAMIDAMKYWVNECGIDGFRCDLASWVELSFWEEARPQIDAIQPLFWLGEFDELEHPQYGKVFDVSYSWKWMHATRDFYNGRLPLSELLELLQQYNALGDASMRAWFTTNHDENSWNGTEYEKYGDMAKALAVFSCTWNGVPLIYSGQELPLKTKRLSFFDKDPIPWNGNYELHDFYKTLFGLRLSHPALHGGDSAATTSKLSTTSDDRIFAYLRRNGADEILVILNLSAEQVQFDINDNQLSGNFKSVFYGVEYNFNKSRYFDLQKWEYLVLYKI